MKHSFAARFIALLSLCLCAALPARSAEIGQPAPTVALPGLAGDFKLAQYKGQVVLLDFWASWCVPCRHSFPWMNQMQAKYGPRGLRVVAVNVDARRADADTFLSQVPAKFDVVFDSAGDTPRRYAVKGMPTSVLIGVDGIVLHQHAGFRDDDKAGLEAVIAAALAKAGR